MRLAMCAPLDGFCIFLYIDTGRSAASGRVTRATHIDNSIKFASIRRFSSFQISDSIQFSDSVQLQCSAPCPAAR